MRGRKVNEDMRAPVMLPLRDLSVSCLQRLGRREALTASCLVILRWICSTLRPSPPPAFPFPDIFECFTVPPRIMAFTQSPAEAEPRPVRRAPQPQLVYSLQRSLKGCHETCRRSHAACACTFCVQGGRFSMFGGSVQGVFREVEPAKRIVMDWRFRWALHPPQQPCSPAAGAASAVHAHSWCLVPAHLTTQLSRRSNWEDGVYSQLELDFAEPDRGNAVVSLKQTGIPDADRFGNHDVVGVTEAGWKNQVFGRIRAVFGYGI